MNSNHQALVLWNRKTNAVAAIDSDENSSRRREGKWALGFLPLCPGRTLDGVYTAWGHTLEKHANKAAYALLGLGPHVVAKKIKEYFGDGGERVLKLDALRGATPARLEKKCAKLIKYSLPCGTPLCFKVNNYRHPFARTESANTQRQAFEDILDLITLFPGLRAVFLRAKQLEGVTSVDAVSALWDRHNGAPEEDWDFWKSLTATCLAETEISSILEGGSIADLTSCRVEGLSIIERLIIDCW
jgi:hypothetical protein